MAATLRDVAEHAQVSVRTVSNVVSGYTHVSAQMRERVMASIKELDYRPNPVARTLRTGRTGLLALVVPEIAVPYFSELARDAIHAASELGYRVLIEQTGDDHERERRLLQGGDRGVLFDGVLFSPLVPQQYLHETSAASSVPLVLLGEHEFDGKYDHVAIDNERAAFDAVTHLVEIGRKRVAAIGAQPSEPYTTPRLRQAGYEAALAKAGCEVDARWVVTAAHYSRQDGYDAARELLQLNPRPDAIFCFSDLLAIGAMRAVFDAGLRVPEDVAIIGVDDIEEGRFARPPLSSVALDTSFIAREAIQRLVHRIDNPDSPVEEIIAPHSLVVRQSTSV